MTEREQAQIWREQIENSLEEMSELRERLHPIAFTSKLWEEYTGAYGDVREDVAFLFCPKESLPEMEKIRRLDFEEKEDAWINFDNLCENLLHQLSFYDATYLAMPYLLLFLEKKKRENDFKWQFQIIIQTGLMLSTDIPYFNPDKKELPKNILESYELSIELLKEIAKEFLQQNMEKLKKEDKMDLKYFCTSLMAIFGDKEKAYTLIGGNWEQVSFTCPNCDYFDGEIEIDSISDKEILEKMIVPAESVLGKWDGKSFEDTYLWFCNLIHMFGIEDEWRVPYYDGIYQCPKCGYKGLAMDWMKY